MTLLQVALDLASMEEAVRIANEVRHEVDILEAGTPLIKIEGIKVVAKLREVAPDKLILADLKTMDVGRWEAEIAFNAGADIMTVCGAAPIDTIISAIEEAKRRNRKVLVDSIGISESELLNKAIRFGEIGADYIGVHTGIDEQAKGKTPLRSLAALSKEIPVSVAVAGGIKLTHLPEIMRYRPGIVIVGGAITKSSDPKVTATKFRENIRKGMGAPL